MIRIGIGYDVHRLSASRKLILGGVEIPHEYGLLGHSDADVLLHAIMDALLGSVALRDIGTHFPDTSPEYAGISSLLLLEKVNSVLKQNGWSLGNIDSVIIAQKPKLKDAIPAMISNIARTLQSAENRVSVKATTEEGLGFTGNESGIAAWAAVTVEKDN